MQLYITETSAYCRIVRAVILEKGLEDRVETIVAQTRRPDSPYYQFTYHVVASELNSTRAEKKVGVCGTFFA